MTRSFARLLPLLLVPALVACDGTEEESAAPLVGTWLLTDLSNAGFVTSTRDVTYPDFSQPGSDGVTVRSDSAAGGVRLDLIYVSYVDGTVGPDARYVTLRSFPLNQPYPAGPWAELTVARTPYSGSTLTVGRGSYTYNTYYRYEPIDFELTPAGISLPSVSMEGYDSQTSRYVTFTVGGSLGFTTRSLAAGAEAEVDPWTVYRLDGSSEQRFVFEPDGTFRDERTYGNQTTSVAGRWDTADGRLRVSIENPYWTSAAITVEYAYRVESGALVLVAEPEPCPRGCVENIEQTMRLPSGTLASARNEVRYRYTPSQSRWLPPTTPETPSNVTPEEARARLLPGSEAAR